MRAIFGLILLLVAGPAAAQTTADSADIRKTALDDIDGFWTGDADRMTGALHPELVKRIRGSDAAGHEWVDYLHMVRWGKRRVILNVLWEMRRP